MSGPVINYLDLQVPTQGAFLDYLFFNLRFANIVNAINGLATRQDGYDQAVNNLTTVGLDRINAVLGPLLNELQLAATTGFLASPAISSAPQTLSNGLAVAVTLTSAALAAFTPTPWILLADNNNVNNWAILSFTSYNKTTGLLSGVCVYVNDPGVASTNWTVSCQPAVIPAMQTLLTSAQAAATSATAAEASIAGDMSALSAAIAAIQAGPVASVAGRTGVITLGISDIAALSTTIAGLATVAALNSGLAGKQAANSILTSLAGLTIASGSLPIGVGAGVLGLLSCPAFGRLFMSATDINSLASATGIATQSMLGTAAAKNVTTAAALLADSDTNAITTDQAWAAGQWVSLGNLSGNLVINCNAGVRFYGTLVGNVTLSFQNLKSGQPIQLVLTQDSTGNRTVTWSGTPTIYWPNGQIPPVSTSASKIALIVMLQEFLGNFIGNGWHN